MASAGDARRLAALFVETNLTLRPDEAQDIYERASRLDADSDDAAFVRDALLGIIGVRVGAPGAVDRLQRALATYLTRGPHSDVVLAVLAALVALGVTRPQDVRPALGRHVGDVYSDDTAPHAAQLAWLVGVGDTWVGDVSRGAVALRRS